MSPGRDANRVGNEEKNPRRNLSACIPINTVNPLTELIFTALAELSTRQIAETDEAKGVSENAKAGKKGGKIAKDARLALEQKTGKKVVTGENFLPPSKEVKRLK